MSFRIGDLVIVNTNAEQPNVNKGDFGIVVRSFIPRPDGPAFVEVSMSDNSCKIMNVTSLDKASEWGF